MSQPHARYALYFAPAADSRLWQFGCSVIGYDADNADDVVFAPGLETHWPQWRTITEEPRKYGFHATLKAPFYLAADKTESDLLTAVSAFGATNHRCILAGLEVVTMGRFAALVPKGDIEPLKTLATSVVNDFEPLRAPLSANDRARRLKSPLTPVQTAYLDRYGYPYVHEEFRFHMTLTGELAPELLAPVRALLAEKYAETSSSAVAIDSVALFKQENAAARFRIIARRSLL